MEKWQHPETIALWIGIICAFVFMLAFLIVRLFQLKYKQAITAELNKIRSEVEFRQQLLELQEKERIRFGADLHDSLIGKLMSVQLKHQLTGYEQDISVLLTEIIADTRRISHDLSPPMMEYIPLDQLIANTVYLAEQQFPISFETDIRTHPELAAHWKLHLLRIIQEVITNSLKHSGASALHLRLRVTAKRIAICLSDNGCGFDPVIKKQGIGMNTIALRTKEIKAAYKFKSHPDKGTTFLLLHQLTES